MHFYPCTYLFASSQKQATRFRIVHFSQTLTHTEVCPKRDSAFPGLTSSRVRCSSPTTVAADFISSHPAPRRVTLTGKRRRVSRAARTHTLHSRATRTSRSEAARSLTLRDRTSDLTMWTDVGKLVLLHLFLVELSWGGGKRDSWLESSWWGGGVFVSVVFIKTCAFDRHFSPRRSQVTRGRKARSRAD